MVHIDPKELQENFFKKIGQHWMLITSGNESSFNTMTASWGGIGWLWNKPVVYIFIRPERYTHHFIEKHDYFSLSFFDTKHKDALKICGEKSGRDCDKIKESGLSAIFTDNGTPYFKEANLVFECRKFYRSNINDGEFIENTIPEKWYKNEGVHTMFIGEIESCFYL